MAAALRYTPRGGHITVRVLSLDEQGVLEVEDSGPGIPPEERERVFDRFYRVLGTMSDGSGLGLAIVREIAQKHQGSVVISDHPTEHSDLPGTRIRVAFPLYSQGSDPLDS
ncbi:Sensor kinase CusS [compost metagenome]